MKILVFLAIPVVIWCLVMLLSLPRLLENEEDRRRLVQQLPEEHPHFARDYTGQLWVEKGSKGFFRPIKRRHAGEQEEE
ncbi:MAG: hypothetical protein ACM3JD_18565 [Rudaea sp.]